MKESKIILVWGVFIVVLLGGWWIYKSGEIGKLLSKSVTSTEKKDPTSLPADVTPISQINANMKGKDIKVKGTIVDKSEDKKGDVFLVVSDETGKISIPVFSDKKIDKQLLSLNKLLYFSGKVDIYNGKVEIIPQSQNDVFVPQDQVIKITKDNIGKNITFKGKILSKYNQASGDLFLTIANLDTNEEISVPIFNKLSYSSENIPTNSIVSIKGKIAEYKGKIEVIPEKAEDINVLVKGDDSKIQFLNVSDITESYRGKMITTGGYVTSVTEKSGNVYFSIVDQNDKNKRIDVVMFHGEANELAARKTLIYNNSGKELPVYVIAAVDKYNGKLELIVDKIYTK